MYRDAIGTDSQPAKAYLLAQRIQEGPPNDPERFGWMQELSGILDRSKLIEYDLHQEKFEENEFGFITLNVHNRKYREHDLYRTGIVEKIEMCFTDQEGLKTTLGGIKRIKGSQELAVAYTYIAKTKTLTERLTPDDSTIWEIIVGTISNAVEACHATRHPSEQVSS